MVDPVFVDTSEGKAIVADSLKPLPIIPKIDINDFELTKKPEKELPVKEDKSAKKIKEDTKVENKRGK